MKKSNFNKVLLIGLDGVPLDLIEKWKEELPTIRKLMCFYGILQSVIPQMSPTAWVSMITGADPGEHDIYDFFKKDDYEKKITTSYGIKTKTIWDYLEKKNFKSMLIQVPYTYPIKPINGKIIAGSPATYLSENVFYPKKLEKEIMKKIPDYKIGVDWQNIKNQNEEAFLDDLNKTTESITKSTQILMKKKWDFLMVVFEDLDRLLHFHWRYMDEKHPLHNKNSKETQKYRDSIKNYFKLLDSCIKKIIKNVDEKTLIMIVSDHGFGRLINQVKINNYLEKWKFLKKENAGGSLFFSKIKEKMITLAYRLGFYNIFKKLPRNFKSKLRDKLIKDKQTEKILWSKTKAWFDSFSGQGIRINLKGREPKGIIEKKDYEKIRINILKKLNKINYNGKKVIKKIYKREELYSKKFIADAPDLIPEMENGFLAKGGFSEKFIGEAKQENILISGKHQRNGMFIIYGKDVKKKKVSANILDITPTILNLFNIKKPKNMKGKILDILE